MKKFVLFFLLIIAMMVSMTEVYAEEEPETIRIDLRALRHMEFDSDVVSIFIGDSSLVKILQVPPSANEFFIVSYTKSGCTTMLLETADGMRHEFLISVGDSNLPEIIEREINLPNVHVRKVKERIMLTGTVNNQYERNYAIQTARLYVGGTSESSLNFGSTVNPKLQAQESTESTSNTLASENKVEAQGDVIDLLQVLHPTKVRLEAQIIEISSDNAKDLGIQYGIDGSGGVFSVGENNDRTTNTEIYQYWDTENNRWDTYTISTDSDVANFVKRPLKWMEHRFGPINATISALVSKGKAKVLSRPSITTLSGEEASIQVGGQIAYSVINSYGNANTKFKDYGIILQLKPIVDAENRISSAIHTEVSSLGGQAADGQPIIFTRRADTVMTLESGSTIVIGGLMDSSESKVITKIPLLGDIPIIGEFFKHTSKSRDKRELIILITPYILNDYGTTFADMSDSMKDFYHEGKREQNDLNDVNLNAPPPPFDDIEAFRPARR